MTYNANKVTGKGTFGMLYRAAVGETGEIVAIKKVLQDRRRKNCKLQIMKELNHTNVIGLRHAFYITDNRLDDVYLNIVMDFVPEIIYRVVKHYKRMHPQVPALLIKLYSYQLMRTLAYIHARGITHCDIKPQNVLADTATTHCGFATAAQRSR